MGTFVEIRGLDKEKFGLFNLGEEIFLYSSGHYLPHVYMNCDECEARLACKPEDLKYFLKEINFMKCPNCGESALKHLRLGVKMEHLISALADLDEIHKKKEEGHCNLDEEE